MSDESLKGQFQNEKRVFIYPPNLLKKRIWSFIPYKNCVSTLDKSQQNALGPIIIFNFVHISLVMFSVYGVNVDAINQKTWKIVPNS